MGKAYSVDLRVRVLAAIDGGLSKMQAHKTFRVSRSTIDDWLRLREKTGSVQDTPRQPCAGRGLAHQQGFAAFAQCHQHSTLEQMRQAWQAWQQETQQSLSIMSLSRMSLSHGTRQARSS